MRKKGCSACLPGTAQPCIDRSPLQSLTSLYGSQVYRHKVKGINGTAYYIGMELSTKKDQILICIIEPYLIMHGIEPVPLPIKNKNRAGVIPLNNGISGIFFPVNQIGGNSHVGAP